MLGLNPVPSLWYLKTKYSKCILSILFDPRSRRRITEQTQYSQRASPPSINCSLQTAFPVTLHCSWVINQQPVFQYDNVTLFNYKTTLGDVKRSIINSQKKYYQRPIKVIIKCAIVTPSLTQAKSMGMQGQWFCWSKNWLGADSINTFKPETATSGRTAWSAGVLSTSGKHPTFQPQLKWASSQSLFTSRIGSFRAFQGVRALASKQSVYCCRQDQISLTNKFLGSKWHRVYISTHIRPEPPSPYNTRSKPVLKVELGINGSDPAL